MESSIPRENGFLLDDFWIFFLPHRRPEKNVHSRITYRLNVSRPIADSDVANERSLEKCAYTIHAKSPYNLRRTTTGIQVRSWKIRVFRMFSRYTFYLYTYIHTGTPTAAAVPWNARQSESQLIPHHGRVWKSPFHSAPVSAATLISIGERSSVVLSTALSRTPSPEPNFTWVESERKADRRYFSSLGRLSSNARENQRRPDRRTCTS